MGRSLKVAVIGAGPSGLVAARELQRQGQRVVVFEKGNQLGGTWAYDPRVEADELGLDPNREIVHSSLYSSLRTNIPRPIMGFSDYSFGVRENGDPMNFFPWHEEVLRFLNDFASDFGITELIRFGNEVVRVEQVDSGKDQWVVQSRTSESTREELFDAVVVCNGHQTQPRLANPPGIEKWSGKQVHSHNYRHPEPYKNQVVVMIGNGASAYDISREVATVAKEVHLSSRSPDATFSKFEKHNIWQHSKIEYVCEDGTVVFQDGSSVRADTIIHCTGYKYYFPFLKTNGIVTVEDNRVGPLYKHVFPPNLAPSLSFVGLPERSIIFLLVELQSKWVAGVLSGKLLLPSKEEMLADVDQHYHQLEECGIPKRRTHTLHPLEFTYPDWLAAQVGVPPVDEDLKNIYRGVITDLILHKDGFRDDFDPLSFSPN